MMEKSRRPHQRRDPPTASTTSCARPFALLQLGRLRAIGQWFTWTWELNHVGRLPAPSQVAGSVSETPMPRRRLQTPCSFPLLFCRATIFCHRDKSCRVDDFQLKSQIKNGARTANVQSFEKSNQPNIVSHSTAPQPSFFRAHISKWNSTLAGHMKLHIVRFPAPDPARRSVLNDQNSPMIRKVTRKCRAQSGNQIDGT